MRLRRHASCDVAGGRHASAGLFYQSNTFPETRPPLWRAHKGAAGMYNYEAIHLKPHYQKWPGVERDFAKFPHQNLELDTDASKNFFFRGYHNLQTKHHDLLGRKHSLSSASPDRRDSLTDYDLNTDLRFRGLDPPLLRNIEQEESENAPLLPLDAHARLSGKVPGDSSLAPQPLDKQHVAAWWSRLQWLIDRHGAAVGDIAPGVSRDIKKVHAFFVEFQQAMTGFEFQDRYLLNQFEATRPAALADLYGVFLELECNYLNPHHCPRCSLPFATTSYCGEGAGDHRFRKFRGRYAPHKAWGKEWFEAVANRAEQLWYRAIEDPLFGTGKHTQLQAEKLLEVYLKTQQRSRANGFVARLYASEEYLTGVITFSPVMQRTYEKLLDITPHPHLLTQSARAAPELATKVLGTSVDFAQSPLQLRIDLELAKFRREQKEEGVVRIPPSGYTIDTKSIVPYQKSKDGTIRNWREVKRGIEQSFLATGLPPEAYSVSEQREIMWLEDQLATLDKRRATLKSTFVAERLALGANGFVFPDAQYYRCFDISPKALEPFTAISPLLAHAMDLQARLPDFSDPTQVTVKINMTEYNLDVSTAGTQVFGFPTGSRLTLDRAGMQVEAVVIGVHRNGPPANWELIAYNVEQPDEIIALGKDVKDIKAKYKPHLVGAGRVAVLEAAKAVPSYYAGKAIGVHNRVLYVQWGDGVAAPLGTAEEIRAGLARDGPAKWAFAANPNAVAGPPVEPCSWATPFRNDWLEERLKALKRAPWEREDVAPLIPHKLTPKKKKFGYAQHDERGDFVTKEYSNRLKAKQFYTNPSKFQVLPDHQDGKVRFGSKDEAATRLCGPPTVDRDEMDRGWGVAEDVPDSETAAVEQALRDISGRRPGNFMKSDTEKGSLKIPEPWFEAFGHAFPAFHNAQQALLPASERKLIDESKLPFGGKRSPLGDSHGLFERFNWVLNDWGKGFDVDGEGVAATTVPRQDENLKALFSSTHRHDSVLRRMFKRKLKELNLDLHSFVSQHCQGLEPRAMLLALGEWLENGRAPSMNVSRILRVFLAAEIDGYNATIPLTVAKLTVDDGSSGVNSTQQSSGTNWADVSRTAFRKANAHAATALESTEGYILKEFLTIRLSTLDEQTDPHLLAHARAEASNEFFAALAAVVGKDIPPTTLMDQHSTTGVSAGKRAFPRQLITGKNVSAVLDSLGFTLEARQRIVVGLQALDDRKGEDFMVPLQVALAWTGPKAATVAPGAGSSVRKGVAALVGQGQTHQTHPKTVEQLLTALSAAHEGLVLDVRYATRQNQSSAPLKRHFATLLRSFASEFELEKRFSDYCRGSWIPSVDECAAGVAALLLAADLDASLLQQVFVVRNVKGEERVVKVVLPDPTEGPFEFESIRDAKHAMVRAFRSNAIEAGPDAEWVPLPKGHSASGAGVDHISGTPFAAGFTTLGDDDVFGAFQQAIQGKKGKLHKRWDWITSHDDHLRFFLNSLLLRCLPLLQQWQALLHAYSVTHSSDANRAAVGHNQLSKVLEQEANTALERDFRQNAEKYWKNIIDGQGLHGVEVNRPYGYGEKASQRTVTLSQQNRPSRSESDRPHGQAGQRTLEKALGSGANKRRIGTSFTPAQRK